MKSDFYARLRRQPATCIAVLLLICASCSTYNEGKSAGTFAAPLGQKTFSAIYDKSMHLPMRENNFLAFLSEHNLKYRISSGEGALINYIDRPILSNDISISDVRRTYDVYDPNRSDAHRSIHYVAYVNRKGCVIYIENRYQYGN